MAKLTIRFQFITATNTLVALGDGGERDEFLLPKKSNNSFSLLAVMAWGRLVERYCLDKADGLEAWDFTVEHSDEGNVLLHVTRR